MSGLRDLTRVFLVMMLVGAILLYREWLHRMVMAAMVAAGIGPRTLAELDDALVEVLVPDEEDEPDDEDEDEEDE